MACETPVELKHDQKSTLLRRPDLRAIFTPEDRQKIKEYLKALYAAAELPENARNIKLLLEVGNFLCWLGRPREASRIYVRAQEIGGLTIESQAPKKILEAKTSGLRPPYIDAVFTPSGRKEMGEYIQTLRGLINNHPRNIALYFELGDFLCLLGRPKEALELYEGARLFHEENAELHYRYGMIVNSLVWFKKEEKAEQAFARSVSIAPSAEGYWRLGNAIASGGKASRRLDAFNAYSRAVEHYQAELKKFNPQEDLEYEVINKQLVEVYLQRGKMLHLLGRYPEALGDFECALQADPKNIDVHTACGITLRALGRNNDAIETFKKALALNDVGYSGVVLLPDVNDFPQAKAEKRTVYLAPFKDEKSSFVRMAIYYYDTNVTKQCIRILTEAECRNIASAQASGDYYKFPTGECAFTGKAKSMNMVSAFELIFSLVGNDNHETRQEAAQHFRALTGIVYEDYIKKQEKLSLAIQSSYCFDISGVRNSSPWSPSLWRTDQNRRVSEIIAGYLDDSDILEAAPAAEI